MKPEIAKPWADKLRGDLKQTESCLSDGESFCCLGVLCELAIEMGVPITKYKRNEYAGDETITYLTGGQKSYLYLPETVKEWAGLKSSEGRTSDGRDCLAEMNDRGCSFKTIANFIESNVDKL